MTTDTTRTRRFTHTVLGAGPAQGMTFSGRGRLPEQGAVRPDTPLVVAVHGGAYTSAYFDVAGYSLLDRAAALGIPVLAVDRPGYEGSTPVNPGESIILANAGVLDHLVGELWEEYGAGTAGVVLIGHSIGGATVSALAARGPSWPLLGIAISGCLLQTPAESGEAWAALPDLPVVEMPGETKDFVMFGPEWTRRADMPDAGHVADSPVPKAELLDITGGWIERVRSVVAEISVPVHYRQGEFDRLWVTDTAQVAAFAEAFVSAPVVDARLVPSSGHCIDFHRGGASFQLDQLAFALSCCITPERSPAVGPST
ncbi:alpha/beta hydrolase [Streptomyces sp. NPDC102360]|uniref:alpha/beta hydrolase n=1 Tax=Streptomyces sp. NPDC102360 TaxID=3366160 RepID=UPI0038248852